MTERQTSTVPVDPDVDLRVPWHRVELRRAPWAVLAVISIGCGLGGLARYGLGLSFPVAPGGFPWATFTINITGCALIGVLMVLVSEVWSNQRLLRPFLGVGVFGGYTTFSFHMVEVHHLIEAAAAGTAIGYLGGTAAGALVAVGAAVVATRWVVRRAIRSVSGKEGR